MADVLSFVVVVLVLAFVGWPLFRATTAQTDAEPESLSPLERQKLDAYAAIKEAEFDLRLGKLSPEDFAELTARYRQQALAAIAALEKATRRERAKGKRPARFAYCPACGRPLPGRANFCGNCGQPLREAVA
jgi:rRNA maturation endonuclease Nob1